MKKLLFILFICIIVGATGCQSTPKAVDRDGINKAIDKIEDEANSYLDDSSAMDGTDSLTSETASTGTGSEHSITTSPTSSNTQGQGSSQTQSDQPASAIQTVLSSTPTTYKKTMSGGKGAIIDAKVIVPNNVTSLGRYLADFKKVDSGVLKKALFGNRSVTAVNGGFEAVMEDGKPATLINGGMATFGFAWNTEYGNYSAPATKDSNHAPGCSISLNDAQTTAQNLLKTLNVSGYQLASSEIRAPRVSNGKREKTGFYEITYYQYVDKLPILTDTANLFDRFATMFQVDVNDRGIMTATMIGIDLTKTKDVTQILSFDQAVALIEKNLKSLWLSKYVPIKEISLEYMLNQSVDGQLYVAPCWRFCVDKTNYYKLSIGEQQKNDSNDLAMDAVTGEMFRIGDRYIVN